MTKVLVVEDNPFNMELVLEILKSLGFEAFGTINGEDAVIEVEKQQFDLILMDIELPMMDGITAMRNIKTKSGNQNIPIIALTAFAMKGDKEKFLADGFDDYIAKPIDVPEFMKKMQKYGR